MNDLLFWVVIGLLGLLLYISPGLFVHRMYEGYAVPTTAPSAQQKATGEVNTATSTSVDLAPSSAPKVASPTHNQIANLMEVLNTPIPVASPTASKPESVGAKGQQPVEYETTASRPMPTQEPVKASEVLKQGDLYASTLPKVPQPGVQGMLGSMGTQARVPAERVVYIERERQRDCDDDRCDKPAANPNCPDMRDYIRKDSIPCWGCKLR